MGKSLRQWSGLAIFLVVVFPLVPFVLGAGAIFLAGGASGVSIWRLLACGFAALGLSIVAGLVARVVVNAGLAPGGRNRAVVQEVCENVLLVAVYIAVYSLLAPGPVVLVGAAVAVLAHWFGDRLLTRCGPAAR